MVAGELSPSALIWLFGDRAVEDDREANGRFLPPSTRWKGDRVARMMEVARGQVTSARDEERLEEHLLHGVGGDPGAMRAVLDALRRVGTHGENQAALADAIYVMVQKRPPPRTP